MDEKALAIIGAALAAQAGLLSLVIRSVINGWSKKLDRLIQIEEERRIQDAQWNGEFRTMFRAHVAASHQTHDLVVRIARKEGLDP